MFPRKSVPEQEYSKFGHYCSIPLEILLHHGIIKDKPFIVKKYTTEMKMK